MKISIKYKLILVIVIITLITIVTSFGINVYLERSFYKDKLINEGMMNARLLGEFSLPALDFGYQDEANAIISKVESIPRVVNGVIFDHSGKVFASYSSQKLRSTPIIPKESEYSHFSEDHLHIYHKIIFKGDHKGTIYLRISTEEMESELMLVWGYKLVVIKLMLILAIIIAFYLLKPISTPIEKLTEVTKKITEKSDFSLRLVVKGSGEIATLYESFNKMLETISLKESERDRAEDERNRVNRIIENTSDMVAMADPNERIIYLNEAGYKLLGWDRDKELGEFKIEDVHPEWANTLLKKSRLPKAVQKGIWVGENSVKNIDQSEIPVSQVIIAHKDDNQNLQFYSTIIRDITEQRKQQFELNQLRKYLANIIDSMPMALIGVDLYGKVTQWNLEAEKISGISKKGAKDKVLYNIFPRMLEFQDDILDSIESDEIKREQKRAFKMGDDIIYEDVTIFPIATEGKKGAVITLVDATKEYEMTSQLNQRSKMDAIGQLAGGIAHDFNNMLSGIMGAADLLKIKKGKDLNNSELSYLNLILSSVGKASDLTSKLLTFARKGKTLSVAVDLHKIISETASILSRTIDKRVSIKLNLSATNSVVLGEISRLQNSLINLGINGSHAISGEGEILIKTKNIELDKIYCDLSPFDIEPGNYLVISVRDSGSGIPPKNLKKIFEPFFTTKESGKGTGLGLAAVYGTVQEHHGAITVNSELGEGSVFHIYLPSSSKKVVEKEFSIDMHKGSGTILLVDDENIIRVTGKSMLEELGYDVIVGKDGKEAVDLYRENKGEIDLAIVDMIMPVMNGREAFSEIMKFDPEAKVVISSGFTNDENLNQLVKLGLSGFIQKPYNISDLSKEVIRVIGL